MKQLSFILALIIFALITVSCSSIKHIESTKSVEFDLIASESFQRIISDQLQTIKLRPHENKIVSCYQDSIDHGLETLKSEYWARNEQFYYWLTISNCYLMKESYDQAMSYLMLSRPANKTERAILDNNMAVIQLHKNKIHQAFNLLTNASSNSALIAPKYNLAKLMLRFDMPTNALEILSLLPNGERDRAFNYFTAVAYFKLNDLKNIMKIKTTMEDSDILLLQAQLLIANNKISEANRIFEKINVDTIFVQHKSYETVKNYFKELEKIKLAEKKKNEKK